MVKVPVPDPTADPVSSEELEREAPFPDNGPVIDTGPAEIDIERGNAGVAPTEGPAVPPEAEMPPD